MTDRPTPSPERRELICFCRGVDADAIKAAIRDGATSVEQVARRTAATTGCGTCRFDIEDLLRAPPRHDTDAGAPPA